MHQTKRAALWKLEGNSLNQINYSCDTVALFLKVGETPSMAIIIGIGIDIRNLYIVLQVYTLKLLKYKNCLLQSKIYKFWIKLSPASLLLQEDLSYN